MDRPQLVLGSTSLFSPFGKEIPPFGKYQIAPGGPAGSFIKNSKLMKAKTYTPQSALALMVLCASILLGVGAAKAQNISFNTITGYALSVNPGPTICEASGTNMLLFPWPVFELLSEPMAADLEGSEGGHHIAHAGETTIVTVEFPSVGFLGANWNLQYKYGSLGTPSEINFIEYATDSPPGTYRFDVPLTFPKASTEAYFTFMVRDQTGDPSNPLYQTYLFTVPFTVLGISNPGAEVPVFDTVVEPQIPYLVLHAPPGDGSSSSFQDNRTTCRNFSTTFAEEGSNSANVAVKLGIAGQVGIFVTTSFEFSVTMSAGLTVGDMQVVTTEDQTCVTVSEGFTTSSLTGPNGGGDIFIGYGTDLVLGLYDYREIPEGSCSSVERQGLIYAPVGLPRKFIYTQEAILSEIAELALVVADSVSNDPRATNNAQNQIDVWNQVLEMNLANVNNPDNVLLGNTSFSASSSSTNETSITVTETNTLQYEHYLQFNAGVQAVIEVAGSGVTGGYEYKGAKRFGETQNQSTQAAQLLSYTLSDDDDDGGGDLFNLSIQRDPMYGTPVFKLDGGTKSSCPYQGGYQRDQPKLTFADDSENFTIENVPVGSSTSFQLKICNESNEARTYHLKGNASTNLNGAVIQGFGNSIFNTNDNGVEFLNVPANACINNASLTITQSDPNILNYENLELFLYPLCEGASTELASGVLLNVYFGQTIGTDEADKESRAMQVFPNPSQGLFTVRFAQATEAGSMTITDLSGKTILQRSLQPGQTSIDFDATQLAKGIYILSAHSGASWMTRKLIID
jgi:hypothetical protein